MSTSYSESRSRTQVCDACINCCCNCLTICLEKLKLKEKNDKYPNIEYKPPLRTRETFQIPKFHQTPIPGRIFEFAQSRTQSDVAIHPGIVEEVITEQPGRTLQHRTHGRMDDTGPVVRRSQTPETGEALIPHLTPVRESMRQDGGYSQLHGTESGGVATPKLQFSVYYDFQQRSLTVDLQSASNLTIQEHKGLCSSFVNVQLYPNTEDMHSSQVVFDSSDPVYDESFKFMNIPSLKLVQEQTLVFKVFHRSVFTRNELVGSVVLPLKDADLYATPTTMEIVRHDGKEDTHSSGDILLSLRYSENGTLGGIIQKVTNLHKHKSAWGLADPYVKVYLLHHGRRISKWKSNIKYRTLIPVFNESFQFDVSTMDEEDLSLDVFVMDYERFKHNEIMGFVRIGANSVSQGERNHWMEMLSAQDQHVAHWHQLLPQVELTKTRRKRSVTF